MATFNVSNGGQLDNALDDARGGDKIVLQQGKYGELEVNGRSHPNLDKGGQVTITSASSSRPAVFDELDLRNVSHLTLDGLEFDDDGGAGKAFRIYNVDDITIRDSNFEGVVKNGYGASFGLQVLKGEDITVENSEFRDFTKATSFINVEDLVVRGNDFYNSSIDSMVFGDVQDVRIENNEVHYQKTNAKHTDLIQFWSATKGGASEDVVIKNNVLRSGGDGETHGIFISSVLAQKTGSRSDFYKDFLIENNTIVSDQYHGLSVSSIDGLTIRNNEVLQTPGAPDKAVTTPRIVVDQASTDVRITGNTAHAISDDGGRSWSVPGNKIVGLGKKASETPSRDRSDDRRDDRDDDGGEAQAPSPSRSGSGDGDAENVRFRGSSIDGLDRDRVAGIDFDEGDRIVLIHYDRNTFKDSWRDPNKVANDRDGSFVRIDSLADIRELDANSSDISARISGDTLVMTIRQDDGTHEISFAGLGDSYDALF